MKVLKSILTIFIMFVSFYPVYSQKIDDLFLSGSLPASYEWGKADEQRDSKPIYFIKSKDKEINGFGTVMTYIKPDEYFGKRLKLSGYIKNENIANWAGMWMRIDSKEEGKMLGFDNMSKRPIKGSNDWTKYEIVLDVPAESFGIAYGVLVSGTGSAWFSGLTLEVVGNDVPTTNMQD